MRGREPSRHILHLTFDIIDSSRVSLVFHQAMIRNSYIKAEPVSIRPRTSPLSRLM